MLSGVVDLSALQTIWFSDYAYETTKNVSNIRMTHYSVA